MSSAAAWPPAQRGPKGPQSRVDTWVLEHRTRAMSRQEGSPMQETANILQGLRSRYLCNWRYFHTLQLTCVKT